MTEEACSALHFGRCQLSCPSSEKRIWKIQKILEEKWQQVLLPKEDRLPQNIELLARGSIGISVGELLGREASYEQLTKRDSQTSGGKNGFNY